jgi:hypothetical protein
MVSPDAAASVRVILKVGSATTPVMVTSTGAPEPTPKLPPFPLNPPWASSRIQLPPFSTMPGQVPHRLGEYDQALSRALEQFGYGAKGYFYYPGGFALATRLEQITSDGETLNTPDRFSKLPPAPKVFSFDYLRHIFIPRTGFFRIIVFIITDQTIQESNETTTAVVAEGWPDKGASGLPCNIASTLGSPNETVSAYIYEFDNSTAGNVSDLTLLTTSTIPSVVTSKAAIRGHFKTGHSDWPKT